ncbi:MAG: hypothetical protein ACO3NW_11260 [Kiritimatiellia bacterium]
MKGENCLSTRSEKYQWIDVMEKSAGMHAEKRTGGFPNPITSGSGAGMPQVRFCVQKIGSRDDLGHAPIPQGPGAGRCLL